mgnify:CR=1 FL=1
MKTNYESYNDYSKLYGTTVPKGSGYIGLDYEKYKDKFKCLYQKDYPDCILCHLQEMIKSQKYPKW